MTQPAIVDLLRRSTLSFTGTVQRLGAATVGDLPVDEHTAVVQVDQVLHAPPNLSRLAGMTVTVQLDPAAGVPAAGDRMALFTNPSVVGESLAVDEVGRIPIGEVDSVVAANAPGPGGAPLEALQHVAADEELRAHAQLADAIVVGRVVRLDKAGATGFSEHDPDWWKATLDVAHVERGQIGGDQVEVLYANSIDVRWRRSPKPRASQEGLWLLHAAQDNLVALAPFQITDPEDYQPVTRLDALRVGE